MTAVSSNYATDVDYYAVNEDDFLYGMAIAVTEFYTSSGYGATGLSPYYYAEITINKDEISYCSNYEKIGTMAHELGHAMGLAENNSDTSSIMCQLSSGRTVNTVSSEDYATVVNIYGGV
jgi:predicted Zn-dependent protease